MCECECVREQKSSANESERKDGVNDVEGVVQRDGNQWIWAPGAQTARRDKFQQLQNNKQE